MADPTYTIPENPEYNPEIRKLQNDDPANAETVFNPAIRQIIENIHFAKIYGDGTRVLVNSIKEYDDTELRSMLAALSQVIEEYAYDDAEIMALVNELRTQLKAVQEANDDLERRLGNLLFDFSDLVFELAISGLINTGSMKQIVVDKIESQDDIILHRGLYANKKVYI